MNFKQYISPQSVPDKSEIHFHFMFDNVLLDFLVLHGWGGDGGCGVGERKGERVE